MDALELRQATRELGTIKLRSAALGLRRVEVWKAAGGALALIAMITGSAIAAQAHHRALARDGVAEHRARIVPDGGPALAQSEGPRVSPPAANSHPAATRSHDPTEADALAAWGAPVSIAQLQAETASPIVVEGVGKRFSDYRVLQQALIHRRAAALRGAQVEQSMQLIRTSTTQ